MGRGDTGHSTRAPLLLFALQVKYIGKGSHGLVVEAEERSTGQRFGERAAPLPAWQHWLAALAGRWAHLPALRHAAPASCSAAYPH